jgi:DNA-binding MarR family transcriptional regulator
VLAFALAWFIRQLPLRETVASPDMADTFAGPRETDSLAVVIDQIGRLDRREGAREIVRRIALRAGVELDPTACWLLAKLSDDASVSLEVLAERANVAPATLTAARDRLLELGLIAPDPDASLTYELTAAGRATQERLRSTGEERLTDLLECWRPDQHPDLARFIDRLAREFFVDDSALRGRMAPAAGERS